MPDTYLINFRSYYYIAVRAFMKKNRVASVLIHALYTETNRTHKTHYESMQEYLDMLAEKSNYTVVQEIFI